VKDDEQSEMITTDEAARLRGTTGNAIRELIKRGKLQARKMYGRWVLKRSDVLAFKSGKPGRPKSAKKNQ